MTTNEIERLAATGGEMPKSLNTAEQLLFLTLRELYSNYRSGAVNRDRAKREKQLILNNYSSLESKNEIYEYHIKIRKQLQFCITDVYKCGCQHCKKLIDIFTGIERKEIPEDVKELLTVNENLREMVRERSERNAELATTIDRVRWALDSENPLEKIKDIVRKEN